MIFDFSKVYANKTNNNTYLKDIPIYTLLNMNIKVFNTHMNKGIPIEWKRIRES